MQSYFLSLKPGVDIAEEYEVPSIAEDPAEEDDWQVQPRPDEIAEPGWRRRRDAEDAETGLEMTTPT